MSLMSVPTLAFASLMFSALIAMFYPVFLSVNAPSFKVKGEEKSNNHSMVTYCCRLSFAVAEGTVCGRAELLYF